MTAEAIPLYQVQIDRIKAISPPGIVDELIKEGKIEVKNDNKK